MRPAALIAPLAALACALPAASDAAATPAPVAAFDLNGTLAASRGTAALTDSGSGNAWGTDAGRRFRTVRQYSGVQLWAATPPAYTLATSVRLMTVSGKRRLLDFSGGRSDDGVYVRDGRLAVVRGGVNVALSTAAVVPAATWVQVVLTRTVDGTLAAYVEGEPVLTFADTTALAIGGAVRLFRDDWLEASAAAVRRVRLYDTALTDAEVRDLQADTLDMAAPSVAVDAGDGLVGARPTITGTVADAGSAPERIRAAVDIVDGNGAVVASAAAPAVAHGRWTLAYPPAAPALTGGAAYTLRVTATDAAGNVGTTTASATADTDGPEVVLSSPGATAGARPGVTGRVSDTVSGARVTVAVDVLDDAGTVVASGPAAVGGDGAFAYAYPAAAPDLAEGRTYTFRAVATDHLGNSADTSSAALSDGVAPQGVLVESPAIDATIPQPFIAGRAAGAARDEAAVTITVLHGGGPVATFGAPVVDGRFSARVPVALGDGAYTAAVRQCDTAGNCADASRAFSVTSLSPMAGWEVQSPVPGGTSGGAPSAASAARGLLAAVREDLAQLGARRLAKPTTLRLTSPVAGTVTLRLYAGSATLAAAKTRNGAAAGLLASGRRRFAAPGAGRVAVAATRAGRAKLRRGKKVTVTVRLTVTPKSGKAVTVDGPLTLTPAARR